MGKIATNKTKNRLNVESHWKNLFNRHATYDKKIIEEIEQLPIEDPLGITPSKNEIKKTIKKMKCDKAPGTSQLTTDMLKISRTKL
jgi:hypothetical protein